MGKTTVSLNFIRSRSGIHTEKQLELMEYLFEMYPLMSPADNHHGRVYKEMIRCGYVEWVDMYHIRITQSGRDLVNWIYSKEG